MASYSFLNQKPEGTPQTEPIPGRESEMVRGRSGGFMFKADIWETLRRCLILGTANGTYYADARELTQDFVSTLDKAIAVDPERVAQEILYASDGRSVNNASPIFALVVLSMADVHAAKRAFVSLFPQVIRTASHLYEFLNYALGGHNSDGMRGNGAIMREAVAEWLNSYDTKALAHQFLKYQQRHDWSARDVLRTYKPVPDSEDRNFLYHWVAKGWDELPSQAPSPALEQIWWWEYLKRNPEDAPTAIAKGRLTHEMAAPIGKMGIQAWQYLFDDMPVGAMLRNLGSLTEIGVLRADKVSNMARVKSTLNNADFLRKARIHPLDVLKALVTYRSGGKLGASRKQYTPVPQIEDILEQALMLSFEVLEPTGKVFVHAVDVSGSMSFTQTFSGNKTKDKRQVNFPCQTVAAVMALATAKAEEHYAIRGFSTEFVDLGITRSDSFHRAVGKMSDLDYGGTDASVAYDWAIATRFHADVFCFWTDGESWAGQRHPSEALREYREKVNPNVKAVYVTLAPYNVTLVDPQDPLSFNLAGFDPGIPKAIQAIANEM